MLKYTLFPTHRGKSRVSQKFPGLRWRLHRSGQRGLLKNAEEIIWNNIPLQPRSRGWQTFSFPSFCRPGESSSSWCSINSQTISIFWKVLWSIIYWFIAPLLNLRSQGRVNTNCGCKRGQVWPDVSSTIKQASQSARVIASAWVNNC